MWIDREHDDVRAGKAMRGMQRELEWGRGRRDRREALAEERDRRVGRDRSNAGRARDGDVWASSPREFGIEALIDLVDRCRDRAMELAQDKDAG